MIISYFSNFLNHHQAPLADELFRLTNKAFYFIELVRMPDSFRKSGYNDLSCKSYLIQAWKDESSLHKARKLCLESDVALFGGNVSLPYQILRASNSKLSFEVSERWLKRGILNLLSPRLLKNMWYYHTLFRFKPIYKLCASAYGAGDQCRLLSYKNRCYKWGYFTKVDDFEVEAQKQGASTSESTPHIMWCARFLRWKHPELPVKLAARLKQKGYRFVIDMFGSGEELDKTKMLAKKLEVEDVVRFCGNRSNDEILKEMRRHDIFLFTSDQNEGWGAVLNEAMSCGCAVVGSDKIGSVPFLVEDGVNGLIYKSEDLDSLEEKVEYLLNNPAERKELAVNAHQTMVDVWSPKNAARQFLNLVIALQNGDEHLIPQSGPCSHAI